MYPGDLDGAAPGINDRGEVAGGSGTCAAYDLRYGVPLQRRQALLWRTASVKAIDLGSRGRMINNIGFAINHMEQVVGASRQLDAGQANFQWCLVWQRLCDSGVS